MEISDQTRDHVRQAYERDYVPLVRLCLLLVGRLAEAEDIVQEAFVRAAAHLEQVPSERVRAYLTRVVLSICRDHWRRRLERAIPPLAWLTGAVSRSPEEQVILRDALWKALMRLPPKQRGCLVLRYYADLPEREVARLLGCSVGSVKRHCHRGAARMREEMREEMTP